MNTFSLHFQTTLHQEMMQGDTALPNAIRMMSMTGTAAQEGNEEFSKLQEGDVAVLPAFGASVQVMQDLVDRNVQIVDTTCPWVSKVPLSFLFLVCA